MGSVGCWFAHCVLAFGGAARAESIEGGADQAYRGRAQVKKTGATYTIVWQIGEGGHVGTGILTSDVLSVFFCLAPFMDVALPACPVLQVAECPPLVGSHERVG